MFSIIALVCALGQDPADCQPPTARDVMKLGEEKSELACFRQAQMSAGKVETLRRIAADEWIKFSCRRR